MSGLTDKLRVLSRQHGAIAAITALEAADEIEALRALLRDCRQDRDDALGRLAVLANDTESAVRRIMEAADEYASAVADIPIPPTPLERALGKDKIERARAELERVVRETLR